MTGHEPYGQMFPLPPERASDTHEARLHRHAAELERENTELRDIICALMIRYASRELLSDARRVVLNPDVTGAVESSLLHIDTRNPGMVILRYGASSTPGPGVL